MHCLCESAIDGKRERITVVDNDVIGNSYKITTNENVMGPAEIHFRNSTTYTNTSSSMLKLLRGVVNTNKTSILQYIQKLEQAHLFIFFQCIRVVLLEIVIQHLRTSQQSKLLWSMIVCNNGEQ